MIGHVQHNPDQGFPWRLLSAPTLFDGEPLAMGRNHASWSLVFARPEVATLRRAALCLNFVLEEDPDTVSSLPPHVDGKPRFTIGGSQGSEVLDILRTLRDCVGRSPVSVVHRYEEGGALSLEAVVEVNVAENELIRACARCGRWEAMMQPRFQRCGSCKSRYYCSTQCQADDWHSDYHEGECSLLRAGKAYEAERRRKLHDNGWWFNHGSLAPESLIGYDRKLRDLPEDLEHDLLIYGRPTPPRDVPWTGRPLHRSSTLHAASSVNTSEPKTTDDYGSHALPPQSDVRPCDERLDTPFLQSMPGPRKADDRNSDCLPSANHDDGPTLEDIPELPPLPTVPGWVPTGDPLVDEALLWDHVKAHGDTERLIELNRLYQARNEVLFIRRQLALRKATEVASQFKETLKRRPRADDGSEASSTDGETMSSLSSWSDTDSWSSDDESDDESVHDASVGDVSNACETGQ
ncbi:hypothetical protein FKP32DRAFT_1669616 [Trametes sanguinea]|nr:hypothetical protein FKP32DRAFT_1669616 [Trametes sanguinea]